MDDKEEVKKEFETLCKNFGLTEEEIDGLIEFFYKEEKPKSKRVLNTIRSDN